MTTFHPDGVTPDDDVAELRELAVARLHKKRDLQAHLLAYVLVNLLLNVIWFLTGPDSFYWPIIPMLGWGIGVAFHTWDVYAPETPSEERIRREMDRLSRPR
jgi:2TM domain